MFGSSRFRAGLLSVLVGDRAIARRSMSAIGLPRNGQGWCQGGLSGAAYDRHGSCLAIASCFVWQIL